jgi:putative lipoic acid-binding regulatory protein
MTDQHRPEDLLEFPCQYQFKALGVAGEDFKMNILHAIGQHAKVAQDAVRCRPSGKGNYQSVSVLLTLHSYQQLTDIYAEMRKVPALKMLL